MSTINRAPWTALVDDDGSNTTGSIWNKAAIKDVLLDPIDTLVETVCQVNNVGTLHDWNPGLVGHSWIKWIGGADLTITGFGGGVLGQRVVLSNRGTANLYCPHYTAPSTQRFTNIVSTAPTAITPGGSGTYVYDGTSWMLTAHDQGAWLDAPYSAGNFGASGGWTVEPGDLSRYAYRLAARTLSVQIEITGSSLAIDSGYLIITIPGGFTAQYGGWVAVSSLYAPTNPGTLALLPTGNTLRVYRDASATAWTATTNGTHLTLAFSLPVL